MCININDCESKQSVTKLYFEFQLNISMESWSQIHDTSKQRATSAWTDEYLPPSKWWIMDPSLAKFIRNTNTKKVSINNSILRTVLVVNAVWEINTCYMIDFYIRVKLTIANRYNRKIIAVFILLTKQWDSLEYSFLNNKFISIL